VDGAGTINTVTVADSASNAVQNGNGAASMLTIGNLTFDGAAEFNLDGGSATTPDIDVTGALTTGLVNLSGLVTINVINSLGWFNGVNYDLISFASLAADGNQANDNLLLGTVSNLLPGQTAQIQISGTEVILTTSGGSVDRWSGLDNNLWVSGTTGPSDNWKEVGTNVPVNFTNGDAVVLDDSASAVAVSGTVTVNIGSGNVTPSITTFNNNALNYVVTSASGFGLSGAGSLTTDGTGTVFMETSNSFTGPTAVNEGILNYQNSSFGVSSAITVASGASVQLQGGIASTGTQSVTVSGSGAANATGAIENVSGTNSSSTPVVLAADSVISSDSGLLKLTGGVGGTGNLILQSESSGNGAITLSGSTVTINNVGSITDSGSGSGTVTISSNIGSNVTGITQSSNGLLVLSGSSIAFGGPISILSGTVATTGAATASSPLGTGGVSISSTGTLLINAPGITIGNAISGSGIILDNNLGGGVTDTTLTGNLSGFTGALTIGTGGGQLQITPTAGQAAVISANATINVLSGATLFLSPNSNLIFGSNINLYGGTIGGTLGQVRFSTGTTTGTISLFANSSLGGNPGHTGVIDGPIVDNGAGYGVTIMGTGVIITFNTVNLYSGATTISAGDLVLGTSNAIAESGTLTDNAPTAGGGVTFANGFPQFNIGALAGTGTFGLFSANNTPVTLNVGGNLLSNLSGTFSGVLSGGGALIKTGTGTQGLSGPDTFTGATTIQAGIVNYQNGTAFGVSSAITVEDNATVQVQGGTVIGGSEALILGGPGAADATGALENVSGNNSYSGAVTMTANTIFSSDSGDLTLNGAIGDSGSGYTFTMTGAGTITLAGADTFTGATTIDEGILDYANGTAFGTNSTITADNGATVQVQGGIAGGSLPLFIAGPGASGATGALENVSGNNSYAGPITLGTDTTISSDSGTLNLTGSIGDGGNAYSVTMSGNGTVQLAGISTYSGSTSVTAGALDVTGSLEGSSSVTVTNGTLEGTGRIFHTVTIGNGFGAPASAVLEPGLIGAVGKLTVSSSISILSDGLFVFDLDSTGGGAGNGASELIAQSVNLDSSSEFQFNDIASSVGTLSGMVIPVIFAPGGISGQFANLTQGTQIDDGSNIFTANYTPTELTLTVVPEPGTWGMLLGGLGMLMGIHRMRKR